MGSEMCIRDRYADRVVFLADGNIVDELHAPTMEEILSTMSGIEG